MSTSAKSLLMLLLIAAAIVFIATPLPVRAVQPDMRSEHSQPAAMIPQQMVAVIPQGKLFHDPKCTYIHGSPQMMTAAEAIKLGYTPCPRCMRKALAK